MGCAAGKASHAEPKKDAVEEISGKVPEPRKPGAAGGQDTQDGRPTTASTAAGDDEVLEVSPADEVSPGGPLGQKKQPRGRSAPGAPATPSLQKAAGKGATATTTTTPTPQPPGVGGQQQQRGGGAKEESPIPGAVPSPKKDAAPPAAQKGTNLGAAWGSPPAPPPSGTAPGVVRPRPPPQGPGAAPPPFSPETPTKKVSGYAEAAKAGVANGGPSPGAPGREEVEILDVSDEEDDGLDLFVPKTLDLAAIITNDEQSQLDGGGVECIA